MCVCVWKCVCVFDITGFCLLYRIENETIEFNLYFKYPPQQITNPRDKIAIGDIVEAVITNATENGYFGIFPVQPDSLKIIGRWKC